MGRLDDNADEGRCIVASTVGVNQTNDLDGMVFDQFGNAVANGALSDIKDFGDIGEGFTAVSLQAFNNSKI
jgi:hypothetical protein